MHDLESRAQSLAMHLLDEHSHGRSWRRIAREDYGNQVNFATLNRFAIHEGKWIPKDRKIQKALGLIEARPEEWCGQKKIMSRIRAMVKQTKKSVLRRHE